jgi:glycosyltransferase involved in cell wall biosynthesis
VDRNESRSGRLKILVVSNLYPPHTIGGYEIGCRDVVEALRARGHDVRVLTSCYGVDGPQSDGDVMRWLWASIPSRRLRWTEIYSGLIAKERDNQRAFDRACLQHRPDLVYFWNLGLTSCAPLYRVERLGIPSCAYVSDYWPIRREMDRWYNRTRPLRRLPGASLLLAPLARCSLLVPPKLDEIRNAQFTSDFVRREIEAGGVRLPGASVIHWGIDTDAFPAGEPAQAPRRLLYVGQVLAHKGVHTAIEAMRILAESAPDGCPTLTIVGGSLSPDYVAELKSKAAEWGLESRVEFRGPVARRELPGVYSSHDVLIFPSVWPEPFSITLLEAMSSGLAVVATPAGGNSEILDDCRNALMFPAEDAAQCADRIGRLLADPALYRRLCLAAAETVRERFRLTGMVDAIEERLLRAAGTDVS